MIRCTIEWVPYGIEERKSTIGTIDIINTGKGTARFGKYETVVKRESPSGKFKFDRSKFSGFDRQKRDVCELLFFALHACGIRKGSK